jgi:carbon-monoxide dehydrogenase medium subunit
MGSLQVRNLGTIGGNLCNASPAADTAPPLLVLNAKVKVRSINKQRLVPLQEFFMGPGKTTLTPEEILTEVQIPLIKPTGNSYFIKFGRRNAFTLSIVSVATLVKVENGVFDDIRIALGSVAPTPIRASKAEEHLIGHKVNEQVIDDGVNVVANEVKPISDVRASAEYRRDMAYVLTKRAISLSLQ